LALAHISYPAVLHSQAAPASTQPLPLATSSALQPLLGAWTAEDGSGGTPGRAVRGGETWAADLDGRVIVRRYFSEYPASPQRAAFRLEGMTVVARTPTGGLVAHDFDNDGHVIDYVVEATDTAIVFTSEATAAGPRFRLTFRPVAGRLNVQFEIAKAGEPNHFTSYVAGSLRRAD
jgi:hypothetical protein